MGSEGAGDESLPPGVAGGMIILETLSHTQVVATVANVRGRVARAQEVSGVEGCACVREPAPVNVSKVVSKVVMQTGKTVETVEPCRHQAYLSDRLLAS